MKFYIISIFYSLLICILFLILLATWIFLLVFSLDKFTSSNEPDCLYYFCFLYSKTQWAYPHLFNPLMITFFFSSRFATFKNRRSNFLITMIIPVIFECFWEIIESMITEIGKKPLTGSVSIITQLFINGTQTTYETRMDTVGDIFQSIIGGIVGSTIINLIFDDLKTPARIKRKLLYELLYYFLYSLTILSTYLGNLKIYSIYIGYWSWLIINNVIYVVIMYIDFFVVATQREEHKNALSYYQVVWPMLIIFPSVIFHISTFNMLNYTYFASWTSCIWFVLYSIGIKNIFIL